MSKQTSTAFTLTETWSPLPPGQLTRRGHRIGELAQLPVEELRSLVEQHQESATEPDQASQSEADLGRLQAAMSCVEGLDAPGLESVLEGAIVVMGVERFLDGLAFPLLRSIGTSWTEGRIHPGHEHLATSVVRRTLAGCLSRLPTRQDAPVALFTTPAAHRHELGALAAAITCAGLGWRVVYLGADVPAEDISAAALETGARVVGLSIACDEERALTCTQLESVAQALPSGITLVVGGHGAEGLSKELDAAGATVVTDLSDFRALLGTLESRS